MDIISEVESFHVLSTVRCGHYFFTCLAGRNLFHIYHSKCTVKERGISGSGKNSTKIIFRMVLKNFDGRATRKDNSKITNTLKYIAQFVFYPEIRKMSGSQIRDPDIHLRCARIQDPVLFFTFFTMDPG